MTSVKTAHASSINRFELRAGKKRCRIKHVFSVIHSLFGCFVWRYYCSFARLSTTTCMWMFDCRFRFSHNRTAITTCCNDILFNVMHCITFRTTVIQRQQKSQWLTYTWETIFNEEMKQIGTKGTHSNTQHSPYKWQMSAEKIRTTRANKNRPSTEYPQSCVFVTKTFFKDHHQKMCIFWLSRRASANATRWLRREREDESLFANGCLAAKSRAAAISLEIALIELSFLFAHTDHTRTYDKVKTIYNGNGVFYNWISKGNRQLESWQTD